MKEEFSVGCRVCRPDVRKEQGNEMCERRPLRMEDRDWGSSFLKGLPGVGWALILNLWAQAIITSTLWAKVMEALLIIF